jgi:hypothetical protein
MWVRLLFRHFRGEPRNCTQILLDSGTEPSSHHASEFTHALTRWKEEGLVLIHRFICRVVVTQCRASHELWLVPRFLVRWTCVAVTSPVITSQETYVNCHDWNLLRTHWEVTLSLHFLNSLVLIMNIDSGWEFKFWRRGVWRWLSSGTVRRVVW